MILYKTIYSYSYSAPDDDAFAKLPDGKVDQLLLPENKENLRNVLLLHVVEGFVEKDDVRSGRVPTLSGVDIEAVVNEFGEVSFKDPNVIQATRNSPLEAHVNRPDLRADNGIIHGIDRVLLPPI